MNNTLSIQKYEEEIAVLNAKVQRLMDEDRASAHPSLYVCTRCGLMYQSPWGCGCPKSEAVAPPPPPNVREVIEKLPRHMLANPKNHGFDEEFVAWDDLEEALKR